MKHLIYSLCIIVFCACSTNKSSIAYIKSVSEYQKFKIEEYRNNEILDLKEDEINDFFKIDEDYNCTCDFIENKNITPINITTSRGDTHTFKEYGIAQCNLKGKAISLKILAPLRRMPYGKKQLFLGVKDKTNNISTYAGGRYIDIYESDVKFDKINIDFNKLYNPYCAYRPAFSCPIPPIENHLDIAIKAGEKYKAYNH